MQFLDRLSAAIAKTKLDISLDFVVEVELFMRVSEGQISHPSVTSSVVPPFKTRANQNRSLNGMSGCGFCSFTRCRGRVKFRLKAQTHSIGLILASPFRHPYGIASFWDWSDELWKLICGLAMRHSYLD
ncbi:hypothetical protein H6F67_09785 [Microcoleus sp. FACHB-1515]|uniref:hypothetical protein n=1 Tax=Cyanophyceae TaxID=3028117 RepID=UPI0016855013|nr:hypothetical protein [Microcoleus sp. FACHB-1515]MBD2090143.1 hypothetical protein [Microcoleus sp. FACHB-1515]